MEEFIRSQIKDLRTSPNARMPRPAQCMIVTRLAPRSIAAHAGVSLKDFLATIDGEPAAGFVPQLYAYRAAERTYTFYARGRHERIELHASGIEIGAQVAPTSDAIKARFKASEPDYKALEALWEARDWAALGGLAAASLQADPRNRGTPALVFHGAALFETGRQDEAMKAIHEYVDSVARGWTMNFTAVGLYYLAMNKLRRGEKEAAVQLLENAYEYNPFDRIAQGLEKVAGRRPPKPAPEWLHRKFPLDYELPLLESPHPGQAALGPTLRAMPRDKLLVVCLLASYRGNGPYADFMYRYHNYATWFAPYLHGLHVLTMDPNRRADRAWYYKGEDLVRDSGLPVTVLHDERGEVTDAVGPKGSPFVLLVDCEQNVVYEGELDGVDLWDTLASVSPP